MCSPHTINIQLPLQFLPSSLVSGKSISEATVPPCASFYHNLRKNQYPYYRNPTTVPPCACASPPSPSSSAPCARSSPASSGEPLPERRKSIIILHSGARYFLSGILSKLFYVNIAFLLVENEKPLKQLKCSVS